ncbi:MAG: PKD domain-containing protein, partial [Phycisphaeraceae bacterium]|nr:PKD domain-containing protein [Phycisphaeraceae bacterium]
MSRLRAHEPCLGAWWCDQRAKVQSILGRLRRRVARGVRHLLESHLRTFDLEPMEQRVLFNSDPTFVSAGVYPWNGTPDTMVVVDIDSDGDLDLVQQPAYQDPSYRLLTNDGTGQFSAPTLLPGSGRSGDLTFADVNGDGRLDLISAGSNSQQTIGISLGDPSGGFGAMSYFDAGVYPGTRVGVGDFDADGHVDLLTSHNNLVQTQLPDGSWLFQDGGLRLFRGHGDGTFDSPVNALTNTTGFWGFYGMSIARVEDINHDGDLDAIGLTEYGSIYLFTGQGNGLFTAGTISNLYSMSGEKTTWFGDLNFDGDLDLVTSDSMQLSVAMGRGDGTFAVNSLTVIQDYGFTIQSVALGDYTNDGYLDLLVDTSHYWAAVPWTRIATGNGDGTFDAFMDLTYPATPGVGILASGDFNGDGWADVAHSQAQGASNNGVVEILLSERGSINHGGPYTLNEGDEVLLDGSAEDPLVLNSMEWDFDYDGVTFDVDAVGAQPSYTAPDGPALRTIAVRAPAAGGGYDILQTLVIVRDVQPVISVTGDGSVEQGQSLTLNLSAVDPGDDPITQWVIDWGDETSPQTYAGDVTAVSHTYLFAGMYNVTATATNEDGSYPAPAFPVEVNQLVGDIAITGNPGPIDEGTFVELIADLGTNAPAVVTYAWSIRRNGVAYAPGVALDGPTLAFTPDDNGNYEITLTTMLDGLGERDAISFQVGNVEPQMSSVTAGGLSQEGQEVTLTGDILDPGHADSFVLHVDWGDDVVQDFTLAAGTTSFGSQIRHVYAEDSTQQPGGSYAIAVALTDDDGGSSQTTISHQVDNVAPSPEIRDIPANLQAGTAVHLNSVANDPGTVDQFTYAWSVTFNGQVVTTSIASTLDFTPGNNGVYDVILLVTDDEGASRTASCQLNVSPQAQIVGWPTTINEGQTVTVSAALNDPDGSESLTYTWTLRNAYTLQVYETQTGTQYVHEFRNDNYGLGIWDPFELVLEVADQQGRTGRDSRTFMVQDLPAVFMIVSMTENPVEGSPFQIIYTVTDPGPDDVSMVYWTVFGINTGFYQSSPTPNSMVAFTPPDNGPYYIDLHDIGGLGAPFFYSTSINVANVPPQVSLIDPPDQPIKDQPVTLVSSVTDPGVNDTFTYNWVVTHDGQPYVTGSTPNITFTPTEMGQYDVTLTVTDKDGGSGSVSHGMFVGLTTNIEGLPAEVTTGDAISLAAVVEGLGPDDVPLYVWTVSRNGQIVLTGDQSTLDFTADNNGVWSVQLRVIVDGQDLANDARTFHVSPMVELAGLPTQSPEGAVIALSAIVTDTDVDETFSYDWRITQDGDVVATSQSEAFNWMPTDDGQYQIALTVTDQYGSEVALNRTVSVTNVVPTLVLSGLPETLNEGNSVSLASAVTDPGILDTFTYAWTITRNGQSFLTAGTPSVSFTASDDGDYDVQLVVTDDEGGSATATGGFSVNNGVPTITQFIVPDEMDEGDAVMLTAHATDPAGAGDPLTYTWTVTRDGQVEVIHTGASFTYTPTDDGPTLVSLEVSDGDGGVSVQSATVAVHNLPPVVAIADVSEDPYAYSVGQTVHLIASAMDPGTADVLTYAWTIKQFGNIVAAGNNQTLDFVPTINGTYDIQLNVLDDDGAGAAANFSMLIALNVSITGPTTTGEGDSLTFDAVVNATEPGGYTYEWTVVRDGTELGSGTGQHLTYVPVDNGTYQVTVVVHDTHQGFGTSTLTVDVSNLPPSLAWDNPPAQATEGDTINVHVLASDPGINDSFSYHWRIDKDGVPLSQTTTSTGDLSFVPDDNGMYVVSVYAVDNDGGQSDTISTVLMIANASPTVTLELPEVAYKDLPTVVHALVSDPGVGDTFTYEWTVTRDGQIFVQ